MYHKVDGRLKRLKYTEERHGDAYRLPDKMSFPIDIIAVSDLKDVFSITISEINEAGIKLEVSTIKEAKK